MIFEDVFSMHLNSREDFCFLSDDCCAVPVSFVRAEYADSDVALTLSYAHALDDNF